MAMAMQEKRRQMLQKLGMNNVSPDREASPLQRSSIPAPVGGTTRRSSDVVSPTTSFQDDSADVERREFHKKTVEMEITRTTQTRMNNGSVLGYDDAERRILELEAELQASTERMQSAERRATLAGERNNSHDELERLKEMHTVAVLETERQAEIIAQQKQQIADLERKLASAEAAGHAPLAKLARVTKEKIEALDRVDALKKELAVVRASIATPRPESGSARPATPKSSQLDFATNETTQVSVVRTSATTLVNKSVRKLKGSGLLGFFPVESPTGTVVAIGLSSGAASFVFILDAAPCMPDSLKDLLTDVAVRKVGCVFNRAITTLGDDIRQPLGGCDDIAAQIGLVCEKGKEGKMLALTIWQAFRKVIGAFPRNVNPEMAVMPWSAQDSSEVDPVVSYVAFIAWALRRLFAFREHQSQSPQQGALKSRAGADKHRSLSATRKSTSTGRSPTSARPASNVALPDGWSSWEMPPAQEPIILVPLRPELVSPVKRLTMKEKKCVDKAKNHEKTGFLSSQGRHLRYDAAAYGYN